MPQWNHFGMIRELGCVNLVRAIDNQADFHDFNTIKVVMNQHGNALYMSRQPIPTISASSQAIFPYALAYQAGMHYPIPAPNIARFRPIAFHAVRKAGIRRHAAVAGARIRVKMVRTEFNTQAVDTQADLERVAILMEADPLLGLVYGIGTGQSSRAPAIL